MTHEIKIWLHLQTIKEMKYRDAWPFGFICFPTLLRPESRGSITLASTDPFDYPRIRPNYLNTQYDVDILLKGKVCRHLIIHRLITYQSHEIVSTILVKIDAIFYFENTK